MKAQTDIGKKKRGADARKGETEKGEDAALGSTGEEGPAPEDPEEGDLALGEAATLGTSKTQEPNQ